MIDVFNPPKKSDPRVTNQIQSWVQELLDLQVDVIVRVSELRCLEEDCPDIETVIAVFGEPGQTRKFRIFKAAADVTQDDVTKAVKPKSADVEKNSEGVSP